MLKNITNCSRCTHLIQWFANIKKIGIATGTSTLDWLIEEVIRKLEEIKGLKNVPRRTF